MKKIIMLAAVVSATAAYAAISITDVSARQRWPWNGLVDVDFTIAGAPVGEVYSVEISAEYSDGSEKIVASTYATEPLASLGTNRVTWNFSLDCPNVLVEDLQLSVAVTPLSESTTVYMVIDLTAGADAAKYPVRYTTSDLPHVQGAIDEACQTNEIWLRRIRAKGRTFASHWRIPADGNDSWWERLTKDYYIAVFETTQQQWYQMTGTWPSSFSNATYRASRPLDAYYPQLMFGGKTYTWSESNQTINANCLLQQLRDRTGLSTLNLPTQAQWVYAACGGNITTPSYYAWEQYYYNGYSAAEISRFGTSSDDYEGGLCSTNTGTACVGSYKPNGFMLYDMIGNVAEDVLDNYFSMSDNSTYFAGLGAKDSSTPAVDPKGRESDLNKISVLGGNYAYNPGDATLWTAYGGNFGYSSDGTYTSRGFRLCVTCE